MQSGIDAYLQLYSSCTIPLPSPKFIILVVALVSPSRSSLLSSQPHSPHRPGHTQRRNKFFPQTLPTTPCRSQPDESTSVAQHSNKTSQDPISQTPEPSQDTRARSADVKRTSRRDGAKPALYHRPSSFSARCAASCTDTRGVAFRHWPRRYQRARRLCLPGPFQTLARGSFGVGVLTVEASGLARPMGRFVVPGGLARSVCGLRHVWLRSRLGGGEAGGWRMAVVVLTYCCFGDLPGWSGGRFFLV